MNDRENLILPKGIPAIELDTLGSGFSMASDHQTGSLLRTLVATKRGGFFHVENGQIIFQRVYFDQLTFFRIQGIPVPEEYLGS